ncbi:MAG TPA: DUF86 domain-containing protein [Anaerolineae bacterium]|nr:DUF86 domain-containing protein [Anaerolineae bacterium]
MLPHDDLVRLRHMIDYGQEAIALTTGKQRADLETDHVLELALTRLLEMLGEAANRVSAETHQNYPRVPWRQIIGLRHRLVHGYDAVDLDILWDIIEQDLPPLLATLEAIIAGNQ